MDRIAHLAAIVIVAMEAVLGWTLGRTTETLIGHVRQFELPCPIHNRISTNVAEP